MGKFFSEKNFYPSCVCSKWSACHGDHFEVCMLGSPPPPWGPRRLTSRPTYPPPPPTLQTPKIFRTQLSRI